MDKVLNYLREDPISFEEFRQVLNPDGESFMILLGEGEAMEYSVLDENDVASEKILGTVAMYDFGTLTLDVVSEIKLTYNNNEDTTKGYSLTSATGNLDFAKALQRVEKLVQNREWIPAPSFLSRIVGSDVPKSTFVRLQYPNKTSVEIFERLVK
jgi:hypothetical protein